MGTRVLSWNDLLLVAQRPNAPDRVIRVAGLLARVKQTGVNDAGFFVRTADDEMPTSLAWQLRTAADMELLRQLCATRQVTVDDDEDSWRVSEWEDRLRFEAAPSCFVSGCRSAEIDTRGPVFARDPLLPDRLMLACPAHWAAIYAVLGEQHAADAQVIEVLTLGSAEPVRVICADCGAASDGPHDPDQHTRAAAQEAQKG